MTYQISSLFPPFFACFLFLQLSIFMIHSVASWEKTQLLNQRLNSVRLLLSQESLCDRPEHEIIAHSADYLQRSERGASLLCFLFLPW